MSQRSDRSEREHSSIRGDLPRISLAPFLDDLAHHCVLSPLLITRKEVRREEECDQEHRPAPPGGGCDRPQHDSCDRAARGKSSPATAEGNDDRGRHEAGRGASGYVVVDGANPFG